MSTRSQLVARVADLLASSSNVAIHASPGAGKTWVADEVTSDLSARGVKVVRLDLSTRSDGAGAMADLTAKIDGKQSLPAIETGSPSTHGAWDKLNSLLVSRPSQVVLILDQFDAVRDYPDAHDFLPLIRELIHRPKSTHCNALFASRRSLEAIEAQVRGISTLASVCYSEYLGAVTQDDLTSLWELSSDLEFKERCECLEWSAGNPSLVQYWLATRPDLRPSDAANTQQVEVMQRLVKYLDTLGLLGATAQLVLGPVVEDWLRERRQLISLGVIPPASDEDRTTLSGHDVFRDVLRRRTWTLNPWGILGEAEIRVRALVETVLLDSNGTDWAQMISKANPGVKVIHSLAKTKQEQDARQFGHPATWLAYTYPQDLWSIISCQWLLFSKVFNSADKNHWKTRFDALARYRTPMAHNRPGALSQDQRVQCRIFSEEILGRIDEYEAGQVAD
jgi:hypothetical protein